MNKLHKKESLIIILFLSFFICLYPIYKTKTFSSDKLLASIPEQNISFYYDNLIKNSNSTNNQTYNGAYLKIKSKTLYFPWKYQSNVYWPIELRLFNSNQHLAIRFVNDGENFQFSSSIHIIDINTFQEIPVESVSEHLKDYLTIEKFDSENGFVQFHCLGKSVSLKVESHYFNTDIFPSISFDSEFLYDISDDGLICTTNLWISPSFCIGQMKIIYHLDNNIYKMNTIEFTPS